MNNTFIEFAKDLLKEDNEPKYGCLMAMISPNLSSQFVEWAFDNIDRDEIVPQNGKSGIETEIHITVLYGFHEDVTHNEVFNLIKDFGTIFVILGKISKFKNDEYDVLKIDVESQDLHDLNALLMDKFADRITNKYPKYLPHQTLAYVKVGTCENINKDVFKGQELVINDVVYSYGSGEGKIHFKLND